MFGIGLPEIIILFVIAAIIIGPIVIVVIVLAHVRKQKGSQSRPINIQPPPLPISSENDLIKEAQLFFKDSNYKSAINALNRALVINNKSESAFYNRGVVLLKMGDKKKAVRDLKIAANLGHEKSKQLLHNKGIPY
jgi:tetratricopeptide (TPR) repeat protein